MHRTTISRLITGATLCLVLLAGCGPPSPSVRSVAPVDQPSDQDGKQNPPAIPQGSEEDPSLRDLRLHPLLATRPGPGVMENGRAYDKATLPLHNHTTLVVSDDTT